MSSPTRHWSLLPLGAVLGLCLVGPVCAADAQPPPAVRELKFGDALFYFFQDDYFTAITRMSAAVQRGELEYHDEEAQLLLGGMHLAYGQHRRAADIFSQLLASRSVEVRDRAWFYLARLRFQRGFNDEAALALASIEGKLDDKLEPLRRQLAVQLLMAAGRYADAAKLLDAETFKGDWAAFMQFNLGVALIRDARFEEGEQVLAELGKRKTRGSEMRALRDKAHVTRAFSLLQRGATEAARAALDNVRLDGPYSNKALLGAAWADIEQDKFGDALVPLEVLSQRSPRDSAVQEALLAAPYALASLKASRQAADAYEFAIAMFAGEARRLDQGITDVRAGKLMDALVTESAPQSMGWFWRLDDVSDAPQSSYLYELMADHAFQENLKNYRDLLFLRDNLAEWRRSIGAFDDMLELARRAYAERLPGVSERYASLDLENAGIRVAELSRRLAEASESKDGLLLANQRERDLLARLDRLNSAVSGIHDEGLRLRQGERVARLRGRLLWDMQAVRSERLWQIGKALAEAQQQLAEAEAGARRLQVALASAPARFAGFEQRIDDAYNRLLGLQHSLGTVIIAQQQLLNDSAVTVLAARKQDLEAFALQARFALAAVYDRAATAEGAP